MWLLFLLREEGNSQRRITHASGVTAVCFLLCEGFLFQILLRELCDQTHGCPHTVYTLKESRDLQYMCASAKGRGMYISVKGSRKGHTKIWNFNDPIALTQLFFLKNPQIWRLTPPTFKCSEHNPRKWNTVKLTWGYILRWIELKGDPRNKLISLWERVERPQEEDTHLWCVSQRQSYQGPRAVKGQSP